MTEYRPMLNHYATTVEKIDRHHSQLATRSGRGAFMEHTLADGYWPVTPAGTTVPSRMDHDRDQVVMVQKKYREVLHGNE